MAIPKVAADSIVGITGIDKRPVYFITQRGFVNPNLTIKGEQKGINRTAAEAEVSIKWTSKLMKNVNDQQVNTKIMDADEIAVFKAAARVLMAAEPNKLLAFEDQNLIWVKMLYVEQLSDADVWKNEGQGYHTLPNEVKQMLKKLADENFWFQMGKVIAVDVFNGNNDRINSQEWRNMGNVMFQNDGGNPKVIGLDTYDPNSTTSNLAIPGGLQLRHLNILKETETLSTTAYAEAILKKAAEAIHAAMKKSNTLRVKKIQDTEGLDQITLKSGEQLIKIKTDNNEFLMGYLDNLVAGIRAGANELKAYLQKKRLQYAAPPAPAFQPNAAMPLPPPKQGFPNKPLPVPGIPNKPLPQKIFPQGILNRMTWLNW